MSKIIAGRINFVRVEQDQIFFNLYNVEGEKMLSNIAGTDFPLKFDLYFDAMSFAQMFRYRDLGIDHLSQKIRLPKPASPGPFENMKPFADVDKDYDGTLELQPLENSELQALMKELEEMDEADEEEEEILDLTDYISGEEED